MKKLAILSAIALSGLVYNTANAQIRLHLGLHFGPVGVVAYTHVPVAAEPAPVYDQPAAAYNDNRDDYYYLPDVDAYYDVNDQCYVYYDGDNWISAAYLPGAYRDYDWRNARRFEVRAPRPYLHNDFYRSRYNGHQVAAWEHRNNRFDGGYANRGNEQHFDNRGQGYNQHFDYNGYRRDGDRMDNRQQGTYWQRQQAGREESNYSAPQQPSREQGGYNQPQQRGGQGNGQQFNNGGQEAHGHSAQPAAGGYQQQNNNRGQGNNNQQPASQNSGQSRGNEHFAQNRPQGEFADHRMSKF